MISKHDNQIGITIKKCLVPILCILFVTMLFEKMLLSAPPEAHVVFEIQVAALQKWGVANALSTELIIEQKNENGSPGLLTSLFRAQRIQAGIQLGFLTGEPTRVLGQLEFSDGGDATRFMDSIADSSQTTKGSTENRPVKPIDGLPPLFANFVSDRSISLFSEGMEKVIKKSFLAMADATQWTNSGKSDVKIAINIDAFRAILGQLLKGLTSSREIQDELQSCLDNIDRLYASLAPTEDALVRLVAVARSASSARKLRTRVDGLFFVMRTKLNSFLDENSTGNETVDEAIRELVSELASNNNEREVDVVVSQSDQTQLIVRRLIEIINASTVPAVDIEKSSKEKTE